MHGRQFATEGGQFLTLHRSCRHESVEFLAPIELSHAHRVLDYLAAATDHEPAVRARDRAHAEVELGREAAVQAQLLGAQCGTPLRVALDRRTRAPPGA
jgi:hypothetical protein